MGRGMHFSSGGDIYSCKLKADLFLRCLVFMSELITNIY